MPPKIKGRTIEDYRKYHRDYHRKWYLKNKGLHIARTKDWKIRNPEYQKGYMKKYKLKNKKKGRLDRGDK